MQGQRQIDGQVEGVAEEQAAQDGDVGNAVGGGAGLRPAARGAGVDEEDDDPGGVEEGGEERRHGHNVCGPCKARGERKRLGSNLGYGDREAGCSLQTWRRQRRRASSSKSPFIKFSRPHVTFPPLLKCQRRP